MKCIIRDGVTSCPSSYKLNRYARLAVITELVMATVRLKSILLMTYCSWHLRAGFQHESQTRDHKDYGIHCITQLPPKTAKQVKLCSPDYGEHLWDSAVGYTSHC